MCETPCRRSAASLCIIAALPLLHVCVCPSEAKDDIFLLPVLYMHSDIPLCFRACLRAHRGARAACAA
ncbi:hypothetical protein NDU88_004189 [Pleurodeles waltl]|uniref:Secreted protein n=1 Tax=Pleurodeles waltl TaxID=8319 RepID=A0AAV7L171_PLEWA|nr:hypothetical protein NDU88_004189 [Pleurodeles waltl]